MKVADWYMGMLVGLKGSLGAGLKATIAVEWPHCAGYVGLLALCREG